MPFSDPEKNIRYLKLEEGMRVADFGTGSGAYVAALAERVGNTGKVYAIDIQQELLRTLERNLREQEVKNVEFVWSDLDEPSGSKLQAGSQGAVVIANLLFQSENKLGLFREAWRVLKPSGVLLVVDWSDSFSNLGPVPEAVVTLTQAKSLLSEAGFTPEREFEAGDHHYGIVSRKDRKEKL